jgi:hypothetical protein
VQTGGCRHSKSGQVYTMQVRSKLAPRVFLGIFSFQEVAFSFYRKEPGEKPGPLEAGPGTLEADGARRPARHPEAAAAAPPPPRPLPAQLPPPPSSPPSLRPPPSPPPPPTAAAALARLLGLRQRSPPRPARPVRPPAAPVHALYRPAPCQLRRWRRSRRPFCQLTQDVSPCLPALLICARLSCSRMAGCGCGFEIGCRKPWSRLKSRQNESGLLPGFQVALLAP